MLFHDSGGDCDQWPADLLGVGGLASAELRAAGPKASPQMLQLWGQNWPECDQSESLG